MMVNVSSVSFLHRQHILTLYPTIASHLAFELNALIWFALPNVPKKKTFAMYRWLIRCKNNGPQMMTLTLNYPSYMQTQKNNTPKNSNQRNKTAYIRRSKNFSRDGGRLGSEEYFVRPRSRIGVGNGIWDQYLVPYLNFYVNLIS